ncbi:hypothetical protein GWK47_012210 [Chionoecetes opilio]|uniref:Uncharacterized protein n=1 Tax=Chionoecetes opilio TaxID=41210 RepID=A0A8J4XWZ6_CHIOP|nr:hypothetical protein GWK47_012210 [Chionoecetes opilio]
MADSLTADHSQQEEERELGTSSRPSSAVSGKNWQEFLRIKRQQDGVFSFLASNHWRYFAPNRQGRVKSSAMTQEDSTDTRVSLLHLQDAVQTGGTRKGQYAQ